MRPLPCGQIVQAAALLRETPKPTRTDRSAFLRECRHGCRRADDEDLAGQLMGNAGTKENSVFVVFSVSLSE
jgi:hypothetical protein